MAVTPENEHGNKILITNAAIDDDREGLVIVRGVLDAGSLRLLAVGSYQREVLTGTNQRKLVNGFLKGERVPDIELAVRHEDFEVTKDSTGILIPCPVRIVDGQQRVAAAIKTMAESSEFKIPRIGAAVYFGTNEEWEKERFRKLNFERTKVSPDVLLRNLSADFKVINILYGMSKSDEKFVLHNRVCWKQHKRREELINALTLVKTLGILMQRFGSGKGNDAFKIAEGLEGIQKKIGPATFRENVVTFFNLIDESHGIRNITYTGKSPQVYNGYLNALARVIARHKNFWNGNKLEISKDDTRRLGTFKILDPMIANLAAGGGQAAINLAMLITEHMNKGRTSKRLVAF